MVRRRSGDSQVKVKPQAFSELDIDGRETCDEVIMVMITSCLLDEQMLHSWSDPVITRRR